MTKELVQIEFRYQRVDDDEILQLHTKIITVGIYGTIEQAIAQGNEALKELAKTFEVRSDDRFVLHGLFGLPNRLVSNTCYSTNGVSYFAKISRLNFDSVESTVSDIMNY